MDGFHPFATEAETAAGDRSRSRDSLFLLARFRLEARNVVREVRVRNLSAGGLMAEYDGAVAIGEAVTVDLRGIGEVAGHIAWATEGRVGIALDAPIDPLKARKPVGSRSTQR